MTIKQACSDILSLFNSTNLDDRISYRFVKSLLFDAASVFTKQDSELRRMHKLGNLWKPLNCVKFEDASLNDCYSIGCTNLKRSAIKIPETYQTGYGYALKVFNIDYSKEYIVTQPSLYKEIKNRPFPTKTGYFWFIDDYIWIPDSSIEEGVILGMFKEHSGDISSDCSKPLDSTFSFPDYIITITKQEVAKQLGITKQIPADENPDLNQNKKN